MGEPLFLVSQMESKSVKAEKEGLYLENLHLKTCKTDNPLQDHEILEKTESESANNSTEVTDGFDNGVEGNMVGPELEKPLFVQVKEEPNSDSDEDIEEENFESHCNSEEKFPETSGYVKNEENEMVIPKTIDTGTPDFCGLFSSKSIEKTGQKQELKGGLLKRLNTWHRVPTTTCTASTSCVSCIDSEVERRGENDVCTLEGKEEQQLSREMATKGTELVKQKCNLLEEGKSCQGGKKRCVSETSGECPFKCSICEKAFSGKVNLNLHMRRHTGQGLFKCLECKKLLHTEWTSEEPH